jgi:hypothetical protein
MIRHIIDLLVLPLDSSRRPQTHIIVKESTPCVKPTLPSKTLRFSAESPQQMKVAGHSAGH